MTTSNQETQTSDSKCQKINSTEVLESDTEDGEEYADIQSKVRGIQYGTCMHPNDILHSGHEEYSIAPGEGRLPIDFFMDKDCEALAFPLFPLVISHYLENMIQSVSHEHDTKRKPLTAKKYFLQRLTNADNRFATHIPYLCLLLMYVKNSKFRVQ